MARTVSRPLHRAAGPSANGIFFLALLDSTGIWSAPADWAADRSVDEVVAAHRWLY